MTNPEMGWSQLTRTYNDETIMAIMNLDMMWPNIYPGRKEINMTTDLDFLVLSFKILYKIE